jgi:hypothetical protein
LVSFFELVDGERLETAVRAFASVHVFRARKAKKSDKKKEEPPGPM